MLAADTIILFKNEMIGKPDSEDDARKIINKLSGNNHKVITGFSLLCREKKININDYDETSVDVYPLDFWEIENYLKSEKYMDAAGAYKIQEGFSKFIKKINGSFHNVMGLPIGKIYAHLKDVLVSDLF